jgi:hypothetical protein
MPPPDAACFSFFIYPRCPHNFEKNLAPPPSCHRQYQQRGSTSTPIHPSISPLRTGSYQRRSSTLRRPVPCLQHQLKYHIRLGPLSIACLRCASTRVALCQVSGHHLHPIAAHIYKTCAPPSLHQLTTHPPIRPRPIDYTATLTTFITRVHIIRRGLASSSVTEPNSLRCPGFHFVAALVCLCNKTI